jgi:hypothetical protein
MDCETILVRKPKDDFWNGGAGKRIILKLKLKEHA